MAGIGDAILNETPILPSQAHNPESKTEVKANNYSLRETETRFLRKRGNIIISGPAGKSGVRGGGAEEMILDLPFEGLVGSNPLWFESPCMNIS